MAAFGHESGLGLHPGGHQRAVEIFALAAGHDVVLLAVEDDDGRTVLRHVCGCAEAAVLVGLAAELGVQQHVLGAVVAHLEMVATRHGRQVDGARPVAGGAHRARLAEMAAQRALQVEAHLAHGGRLLPTGGGSRRGQVSARGEAADGHEARVEMILSGLTAHKADDGANVVQLGRPLGVHARTVVGAHHGIARREQRLDDGAQVGGTLAVVVEPRAAVDVYHHGVGVVRLFGQVDVARVERLAVGGVVHVLPLLAGLQLHFRQLHSAEASCGLGHGGSSEKHCTNDNGKQSLLHLFLVFSCKVRLFPSHRVADMLQRLSDLPPFSRVGQQTCVCHGILRHSRPAHRPFIRRESCRCASGGVRPRSRWRRTRP